MHGLTPSRHRLPALRHEAQADIKTRLLFLTDGEPASRLLWDRSSPLLAFSDMHPLYKIFSPERLIIRTNALVFRAS